MGARLESVANALWYLFTRTHLLEGRYSPRQQRYRNWDRSFTARPTHFLTPHTEGEICEAVKTSGRVGVVGAGHSFNDLHLTRATLLSLDGYEGLQRWDPQAKTAVFKAGTRLRDVAAKLKALGLALPVLPDHNAQSLGGVLATDVHASGRPGAPAHVSEAVNYLRVVDGNGVAHDAYPNDALFRATVGGMGCTGVVVEVGFQCVAPFRVKTRAFRCSVGELLQNLDTWRSQNELLAAGYFPSIDACVVELKNRTEEPLTRFGPLRETLRHVGQAIVQSLCLTWSRRPHGRRRKLACWALDRTTKMLREYEELVLDNFEGFNRNVYQVHSEAEFTVPLARAREAFKRGRELMLAQPASPHYLLGIRMSQANPHTLVGPGAGLPGAQLAWIAPHFDGRPDDPTNDGRWRELCEELHGRPHYGKNLLGLDGRYLAQEFGVSWSDFLTLVRQYDPLGKFSNALTAVVHTPALEAAPSVESSPPPSLIPSGLHAGSHVADAHEPK